eukprot:CAMPEP_0174721310 /NCGR_PEP_ID=MMETSP1094-20130205/35866_1 /TAXON_ID=156173 /ORGANISM="Chrysochromulina brevifilum, Strain UTEX LB 985" /LENGTH=68 /DNA_ID=CAMNT_0015921971 /DNA_START=97 /DNA_END=300 /DNA_ORIENTATION=+
MTVIEELEELKSMNCAMMMQVAVVPSAEAVDAQAGTSEYPIGVQCSPTNEPESAQWRESHSCASAHSL